MRAAVWLQFLVCVGYTLFNSSLKIILKVPSVFNLLLGAQDLALSKGLHLVLGGTRGKVAAKYTARLIWRLFRWCLCAVVAHLMCKSDYSEKCRERSILWSVVFASGTVEEELLAPELQAEKNLLVPGTCRKIQIPGMTQTTGNWCLPLFKQQVATSSAWWNSF